MKFTVNQLICLLEICRGTLNDSVKIGTRLGDIELLLEEELIVRTWDNYKPTIKGNEVMSRLQNVDLDNLPANE